MHVEGHAPSSQISAFTSNPAVPSYRSSVSSAIWSHGSSYDQLIPVFAQTDSKQAREPPAYRYELGGILVYDSRASLYDCPEPAQSPPSAQHRKRSLDFNAPEADRRKFATMPAYEPFPVFAVDSVLSVPPDSLRFDSRFESGNLKQAIRMMENEYSLVLQEDTNTNGHTQWFYFSVTNRSPGTHKFTILNLYKSDSLYADGMLPAVLSTRKAAQGWHHAGTKVAYFENSYSPSKRHFSLTFTYTFEHENDTVYFAHSIPYTYEDLCKWMHRLKVDHPDTCRVNSMCQTLAGNVCELLTITEDVRSYKSFESEAMEWYMSLTARKLLRSKTDNRHRAKRGVVLTARVHPGETVGSHMLRGAVEFLLSDDPEAVALRTAFVFKVVPMLNPDGVRYGNYRCSLLGVDLNRRWLNPSKTLHPTVFYTKRMLQVFAEEHQVAFFCDFHGHSCKRNVFMYGCSKTATCFETRKANVVAKVLPLVLSSTNRLISWTDCHFRMDKSKEATARSVVCTEFNIMESYTIEASFYGPGSSEAFDSPRSDLHMLLKDYEGVGVSLMRTSMLFSNPTLYLDALGFVRDLLRVLKPCLSDYQLTSFSEQSSPVLHRCLRPEEEEQQLWESLVELDNFEEDFQSSGESSGSSESESEEKSKTPPSRSSPRLKVSTDGLPRGENALARCGTSRTKSIRSGVRTPTRLPLANTQRQRKFPRPQSPLKQGDTVATEPSPPRRAFRLEVRGHTHRSQHLPMRQRSLKKPLDLSNRVCMIESMRKALRKGSIKPLLCSPVCPGIVDSMRVSARRLRTFSKTPD